MELLDLCSKDLAEQQITYRDPDESGEFEGIITIKEQMTIWWSYNNKESQTGKEKIMLIDKYVAA